MKTKILAIIFIIYFSVYLWLKVINEISFNSIEYIADLNELLILVIFTSITYYFYVKVTKTKDIFTTDYFRLVIPFNLACLISFLGGLFVSSIISVKIGYWSEGNILVSIAVLIFSTFSIFYSLRE